MTERNRRLLWAASVIVAFILGFLLGRRMCERSHSGGAGGGSVVSRGGGPAAGTPARLKPGTGQGQVTTHGGQGNAGMGVDSAVGTGSGNGGGGEIGGGGGNANGDMPGGDGPKPQPNAVDTLSPGFVAGMSRDLLTGAPAGVHAPPSPTIATKTADDFSLDATSLPRYPMDVSRAYSGISTRSDKPADTGSAAVFSSSDSFDSVSAWYRAHMPAGAHETNIDVSQLRAMAAVLTPKNIARMFVPESAGQTPADTTPKPDTTGAGTMVAGWQLPDDGVHGARTVMVVSSPGKPTTVMMGRSRRAGE